MGGYSWRRDRNIILAHRQRVDDNPPICKWCNTVIAPPRRYVQNVKYCSTDHRNKAYKEAARRKQKADKLAALGEGIAARVQPYPEERVRRGPTLAAIRDRLTPAELDDWVAGKIPDVELHRRWRYDQTITGFSTQAIAAARRAEFNDRLTEAKAATYTPAATPATLLGPNDAEVKALLDAADDTAYSQMLDALADSFVKWRATYFTLGGTSPYITKTAHRRWIRAILDTIYTGGRLMVLSPPRHGKTELLIHFCVWQICRNPDIRILWIGPNQDIANNSLGQVRNILESDEKLRVDYLGPHGYWSPQKRNSASVWQATRFTVATRSTPLKMPTMWSAGVSSRVISLDADFIVVDDPADPGDSQSQSGREKIASWFRITLLSRKMHHTGLAMISSRVHPDDLYSLYVDSPNWKVIVDRAHDQGICGLNLYDEHVDPHSCVLFPEINPLEYLRLQSDDVGERLFDMMYLNQPHPEGTVIFDLNKIRELCVDIHRDLGVGQVVGHYRLVAGLDPAPRNVQAAFLWAVRLPSFQPGWEPGDPRFDTPDAERYYMVDMETQQAGGIEGALNVLRDWHERYGVTDWVLEDNSHQVLYFDDPRMKALGLELGLNIVPSHSGKQTYDKDFGVASMALLYHAGKISLPYATREAQRKTNLLLGQLSMFTGERAKRVGTSDILMASYFPFASIIKRWRKQDRQRRVQVADREFSYIGYEHSSQNDVPWERTAYPGN